MFTELETFLEVSTKFEKTNNLLISVLLLRTQLESIKIDGGDPSSALFIIGAFY